MSKEGWGGIAGKGGGVSNSRHDSVTDNNRVKCCAADAQHSQGLWGYR